MFVASAKHLLFNCATHNCKHGSGKKSAFRTLMIFCSSACHQPSTPSRLGSFGVPSIPHQSAHTSIPPILWCISMICHRAHCLFLRSILNIALIHMHSRCCSSELSMVSLTQNLIFSLSISQTGYRSRFEHSSHTHPPSRFQ